MADVQLSETSPPAQVVAAAPSTDLSVNAERGGSGSGTSGGGSRDGDSGTIETVEEDSQGRVTRTVMEQSTLERISNAKDLDGGLIVAQQPFSTVSFSLGNKAEGDNATSGQSASISTGASHQLSQSQPQTYSTTSTLPHPPLKRFTSVNITKRFLEKTPLPSGSLPGGSSSSSHHPPGNTATSAQRRGISPSSVRPPSIDRPASLSSRLITAKLTAVPQPLSGSTAGWLKPNQTPGSSATSTPPSSSPQPTHDAGLSVSQTAVKSRRSGEPVNGITPPPLSSAPQSSNRPVWRRVPPAPLARSPAISDHKEDFPTAAEAVHGRKLQASKAQAEAEAAAAQKAAALNETAAAFRGVHLDANARHWDEMEDEDSDFLNGVIEFGDGRQYKIEQRRESEDEQPPQLPPPETESQEPVPKEERFGKDIGRDWPKSRASIRQSQPVSLPPRPTPLQPPGRSPTEGPPSASAKSSHDGVSPTSRVLFNERSNRLEPWNSAKPPRHQGPQLSPRDGHPPPGSVHLLQKGPSESAWKTGPPRGFSDRGRWDGPPRGPPSGKEEERPWELQRRESVSSVAASSVGERSRGRESRLEDDRYRNRRDSNVSGPPSVPILPPSLSRENGRHPPPHLRMPPPPAPPLNRPPPRDFLHGTGHSPTSPSASVRSVRSLTSEQGPSVPPSLPIEVVDKDALVKDAMHLANERARRRKQEGEEEERQRAEAAERARKKAEAIAVELEEKRKAEEEAKKAEEVKRNAEKEKEAKMKTEEERMKTELVQKKAEVNRAASLQEAKEEFETPLLQQFSRTVGQEPSSERITSEAPRPPPSGTLPRKPIVDVSPAAQAESWRSRGALPAAPAPVIAKPPPSTPRPTPSVLLRPPSVSIDSSTSAPAKVPLSQATQPSEVDLSIKPDEEVEVIDFCDMEKLMSPKKTEDLSESLLGMTPASETSSRPRRPVAADFFNDTSESSTVSKTSQSWRRPAFKVVGSADELRTQTVPIFSAEEPLSSKSLAPVTEAKAPSSPTIPSSRRFIPHVDQGMPNGQPVIVGARSRVVGQYKEAPMSALDDTMSRIKGALDVMQSQDSANVGSLSTTENRQTHVAPAKTLSDSSTSWRSQREVRIETSRPPVSKAPQQSPPLAVQAELFATTRSPPPPSPKPVWNVFTVRIPKVSLFRDPLSRKQLHLWNLPHQGVRWDILSWDPPVEGMSKKELSRDEIFHKKNTIKNNGKLRVSLPSRILHRSTAGDNPPLSPQSAQQTALVIAASVKVKLPSVSSFRQFVSSPPQDTVPLWRKSAMPLTPLRKGQAKAGSGGVTDTELNTTSRSPPPDPSTPVAPANLASENTGSLSEHSATVSLPTSETKSSIGRQPVSQDENTSRVVKDDSGMSGKTFVPYSTLGSELDTSKTRDFTPSKSRVASDPMPNGGFSTSMRDQPAISRFVANRKSGSKDNYEHFGGGSSETTTTHLTPPWGKSSLSFSVKDSPGRNVPDPEHLKAVWSQSAAQPSGSTSNSLKGITDELPSIPFNVQDMKSEDGETPPPTAPAPTTTRLSLQEVTRAFQQVPDSPAGPSSRPNAYAPAPFVSHIHRPNQPVAITLPPGQSMRPTYAPYPHAIVGHSPSPTLVYAPGMPSPIAHHRMPVSGPSPQVAHGMWLSAPQPPSSQHGTWRPGAPSGTPTMMYPPPGSMTAPGQIMPPRRMSVISPPNVQAASTGMYGSIPMDMHGRSPHPPAMGVPMGPMHIGPIFSPQPGQAPIYAMPGAGRGSVVPRPGYEGYPTMPPHAASYQAVPTPSFMFQQS